MDMAVRMSLPSGGQAFYVLIHTECMQLTGRLLYNAVSAHFQMPPTYFGIYGTVEGRLSTSDDIVANRDTYMVLPEAAYADAFNAAVEAKGQSRGGRRKGTRRRGHAGGGSISRRRRRRRTLSRTSRSKGK